MLRVLRLCLDGKQIFFFFPSQEYRCLYAAWHHSWYVYEMQCVWYPPNKLAKKPHYGLRKGSSIWIWTQLVSSYGDLRSLLLDWWRAQVTLYGSFTLLQRHQRCLCELLSPTSTFTSYMTTALYHSFSQEAFCSHFLMNEFNWNTVRFVS